jgi:hypothetical protein
MPPRGRDHLRARIGAIIPGARSRRRARGRSPPLQPYHVDYQLATRWINFENPRGASGFGNKVQQLTEGRRSAPARILEPGEMVQLCDVEGPGTIRHFWCATEPTPLNLRSLIVRAWFDDQDHPSIECPLGDFMGLAHGKVIAYCSAVHSPSARGGFNLWLPMPFTQRARLTLTNDGDHPTPFFFQLACTLGDRHARDVGRLHALFRRENPTKPGGEFELLPLRSGRGRFMGAVIGVRSQHEQWWNDGEVRVFVDGDRDAPTLCGTGGEDYFGLGFELQQTPHLYHGCNLRLKPYTSMYRWHLPDPILWQKDVRVTIQQLPAPAGADATPVDDWSSATFWYEPTPSLRLPPLPEFEIRTRDLPE